MEKPFIPEYQPFRVEGNLTVIETDKVRISVLPMPSYDGQLYEVGVKKDGILKVLFGLEDDAVNTLISILL